MDILAGLDGLRKQATMANGGQRFEAKIPDLDLDSLLSTDTGQTRELRRNIDQALHPG